MFINSPPTDAQDLGRLDWCQHKRITLITYLHLLHSQTYKNAIEVTKMCYNCITCDKFLGSQSKFFSVTVKIIRRYCDFGNSTIFTHNIHPILLFVADSNLYIFLQSLDLLMVYFI
ncbi:MAG: hypothetical protein A2Z29_09515 [Chloroflexi bacterium RBG_16_56_11]|nr:MAG: hypothetical protein A2Z29_09515 [Chloroflexi bacterium RBG_16_56_11]